jgi:integrase-like protein
MSQMVEFPALRSDALPAASAPLCVSISSRASFGKPESLNNLIPTRPPKNGSATIPLQVVPLNNWTNVGSAPQIHSSRINAWLRHSGVSDGKAFRRVLKGGILQGAGVTANVVWYAAKRCAGQAGINNLAPHDLRRTCARLCHGCGGELEQIQFLLGHASVQTTERYIGSKQKLQDAVNDRLGISVASDAA